jgi:hypothetical protein
MTMPTATLARLLTERTIPVGRTQQLPPPRCFDEVARWFKAAGYEPLDPEICQVAWLIEQYRELRVRDVNPKHDVFEQHRRALRGAAAGLKKALSPVLDELAREEAKGDPAVTRLIDLWNALILADPCIGPRTVQGWKQKAMRWNVYARGLGEPVLAALVSAGHPNASLKQAEGPAVEIIRAAIEAVTGEAIEPGTVAGFFKRARRYAKTTI